MRNILLTIAIALSGTLTTWSQTTLSEIAADPDKAGGVYYAYPVTTPQNTPAPKGYKPFYISHYGRHGSRYLISDADYRRALDRFDHARANNALTPLGKDVHTRLQTVWQEASGRGGELSPLGNRQHHAIAQRMYRAFPQVFESNPEITASSTVIMRCAHSMFAFIEGLKELNPNLKIPRESGERDMCFLNYHSAESGKYTSHDAQWYQEYRKFRAEKTHPDRLVSTLFADSLYVRQWVDPVETMWDLYWVAVDMQNMETDVTFYDLFTAEELYDLWQVFNFQMFARNSSYLPAKGLFVDNAKNLVENILAKADQYIAQGKNGATLRFGHDGNIIPFVALLRLDNCYSNETNPYLLADSYADFRICPMGANFQMIFFKNKAGDVIVKFMLNERETAIPVKTDIYPFYHWADARAYLQKAIDTPYIQVQQSSGAGGQ